MEKKSNKQKASKQKNERRENPSRIKKFLVRQGITDSLTTKLDLIIDNKTSDTVIQLIQVIAKIKAKKSNVTDSKKIEKYDALLEKAYNALSIFKKNDADVALNGATDLTTKKPSQGSLLTLLDALINKTDVTWAYISKNNESRRIDQGARGEFNRAELTGLLDKQSPVENEQMLKNMEGEFGQRLRSVLDFATEKVGENDVGDSLISKTSKCGTMMVDLIVALRDFLGKEEIEITAPPKITRLIDLKDSETRTLSLIGIERPMLE